MRNLAEACKDCPNRFYALDLCFNSCSSSIPRVILQDYEHERNKKDSALIEQIRADLLYNVEMHEDGDWYLRKEWVDDIFDKYKAESEAHNGN